jgi:hypothetical protein
MPSSAYSRLSQVAFLTRKTPLPLSPLAARNLELIVRTILQVWSELALTQVEVLERENEVDINTLLESALNTIEDPVWTTLVSSVGRGIETMRFDGEDLEKRPDLSLTLTNRRAFRLVVECKIIDKRNGRPVRKYAYDGVSRFLRGEYAWWGREGLMVGYVRDGSTIEGELKTFLARLQDQDPDPFATAALPTAQGPGVSISEHGRQFRYRHRGDTEPGPIQLWHLWLPVPERGCLRNLPPQ